MYETSTELLATTSRLEQSQALNATLDVEGLERALSRATGFRCSGLTLKAEGGFHRIYFAHFDGQRDFVARVAFDTVAFDGMKKMESEVATIAWLAQNTDVPVPTIVYYDPTAENEAHAPFMIMEKVRDMTLEKRWQTMSFDDKCIAIKSLAKIVVSLAQTQFDRIGSLYPPPGDDSGRPVIGPMLPPCVPWFFTPDISLDSGPWRSEREYLLACISRERAATLSHQSELQDKWRNEDLTAIGWDFIFGGYLTTYDRLAQVVSALPGLDEPLPRPSGPFALSHPDLNNRNIMISADDPSQLTLLDWDFASTTPLWNLTSTPEFLFYESAGPRAPELRAIYNAECEIHFPDPALWRSQCNRATLMILLERTCQVISLKVGPATIADLLDQVLSKTEV